VVCVSRLAILGQTNTSKIEMLQTRRQLMTLLRITKRFLILQGTAAPLLLTAPNGQSIADAAWAVFDAAQLNWSSPRVAQRLPLPLKRTDEELAARAAQVIRRIS